VIAEELDSREDMMTVLLRLTGLTSAQVQEIMRATDQGNLLYPDVEYRKAGQENDLHWVDLRITSSIRGLGSAHARDRTAINKLWDLLEIFPSGDLSALRTARTHMENIHELVKEGKRILSGLRESPGFIQGDPERLFDQLLEQIDAKSKAVEMILS
jgi:hypothetical protein